jgi:hypothetical protein
MTRFGSLSLPLLLLIAACTAGSEGTGSNTNWLVCAESTDCPGKSVCVDQICEEVGTEACAAGAVLTLESSTAALEARQGSFFADALYEPMSLDEMPVDWLDPVTPAWLTARVSAAGGAPLPGCELRWITHQDSGWVFPQAVVTDADGIVTARWIAGAAEAQRLTVALLDGDDRARSGELDGHALSHAPASVRPTLASVYAPLADDAEALRVRLRPLAAPHRSFFATALPDFFMGLQNTSDLDAFVEPVAAEDRLLLASVWHRAEGDAEQLWSAADVTCGPHDQDLGGIRCDLQDAWQPGDTKDVVVEFRYLTTGQAAPAEYAELGYAASPCASELGCTDYTIFIADADGEPRRLAALRIASGTPVGGFSSYIDAYGSSDPQTSCLSTPLYQVEYGFAARVAGSYTPLREAFYSADYALWANQICANHGVVASGEAFTLSTGGDELFSEPLLPDDEDRAVSLP